VKVTLHIVTGLEAFYTASPDLEEAAWTIYQIVVLFLTRLRELESKACGTRLFWKASLEVSNVFI